MAVIMAQGQSIDMTPVAILTVLPRKLQGV